MFFKSFVNSLHVSKARPGRGKLRPGLSHKLGEGADGDGVRKEVDSSVGKERLAKTTLIKEFLYALCVIRRTVT